MKSMPFALQCVGDCNSIIRSKSAFAPVAARDARTEWYRFRHYRAHRACN